VRKGGREEGRKGGREEGRECHIYVQQPKKLLGFCYDQREAIR